jgi:hypothetical protein
VSGKLGTGQIADFLEYVVTSLGCITIQNAWNERGGLVHPVNSFLFHDSSSPKAKFLKGTEENQVKRNVLVRMVIAASCSTDGTQNTVGEQLGTHKPHTIWIKN